MTIVIIIIAIPNIAKPTANGSNKPKNIYPTIAPIIITIPIMMNIAINILSNVI